MPGGHPSRPRGLEHYRPSLSIGLPPTTLEGLGLDEVLYREAETRRLRQEKREEEAWRVAQLRSSKSKLSRNSRALCQNRLERELRAACLPYAHESTVASLARAVEGDAPKAPTFAIPCQSLCLVLGSLGLWADGGEEKEFCEKLGLFLDRERCGAIFFERLLAVFIRALDRDAVAQTPRVQAATLEQECFQQLELELLKTLSRLLACRLSRRKSPARSASPSSAASCSARGLPTTPLPGSSTFLPVGFGMDIAPDIVSAQHSVEEVAQRFSPRPRSAPCSARGSSREASTLNLPGNRTVTAKTKRAAVSRTSCRGGEAIAASRCHLLYHQAIFASRESAHLEEEIKVLRQKEELRECTFRPKLISSARRASSASPAVQPRNFETTVARMRNAYQRKVQRLEENEHIPCGENYERLRRLGMQPFSFYWKDKARELQRRPLMYLEVNLGGGRSGRISVREGDDLQTLSRNFARSYHLDRSKAVGLEALLRKAYAQRVSPAIPQQSPSSNGSTPDYERTFSQADVEAPMHRSSNMLPTFSQAEVEHGTCTQSSRNTPGYMPTACEAETFSQAEVKHGALMHSRGHARDHMPTYSKAEAKIEDMEEVTSTATASPSRSDFRAENALEDPELSFGGGFRHVDFQVALTQQAPPPKECQAPYTSAVEAIHELRSAAVYEHPSGSGLSPTPSIPILEVIGTA